MLAAALAALSAQGAGEDGWEELFNGRDLSGWRVVGGEAKFSVEDGCIVGTGVPSNIGINTFVATEREFSDFDLKVEFLCESGNSGVQFRSADRECEYAPRRKVFGYQAEITSGGGATGRIYDEERRGYRHGVIWLDANTPKERAAREAVPIDQQMARKAFDQKGDNELVEIVMDGRRVLRLNGMEIYDSANPAPAADAAGKNKEAK